MPTHSTRTKALVPKTNYYRNVAKLNQYFIGLADVFAISNDFYWRKKSNAFNVVQCNTTRRPIIFHRPNLYGPNRKL